MGRGFLVSGPIRTVGQKLLRNQGKLGAWLPTVRGGL